MLLRPLPFGGGDRLLVIRQSAPGAGLDDVTFSVGELDDYRARNHTLDALVEYHSMFFTLLGGSEPLRVRTGVVSAEFFDVFGVEPLLGRTFVADDEVLTAQPALVLSYRFWQRQLGGDPEVVGRAFEMNDRIHKVVGVLPPVPQYPDDNDVYMPTTACPFRSDPDFVADRDDRMMTAFGLLRPGVGLAAASADLAAVAEGFAAEHPDVYPPAAGFTARPLPLRELLTRDARPTLLLLLATVGLVLLIACANVANLTLARTARRERELAVRSALGAGRRRLVRQLLTESALLGLGGGALGLAGAAGGLGLLVAFIARFTPRAGEIRIDGEVLLFTLATSLITGLVFGAVPAFGRRDPGESLAEGGGRTTAGAGAHRVRSLLIVGQIAVSLVLLVAAGLSMRSLLALQHVDPGFRQDDVLTLRLSLNWSNYTSPAEILGFYRPLMAQVEGLPGVLSAGVNGTFPLAGTAPGSVRVAVEGRPVEPGAFAPLVDLHRASPDYLRTVGIPLETGRSLTAGDDGEAPKVALVNRTLARRLWADGDPLGARISTDDGQTWWTVVGVVGDAKQRGLGEPPSPEVYLPFLQAPTGGMSLLVRTRGDPRALAVTLRQTVHRLDPEQPVTDVRTLAEVRAASLAPPRLRASLIVLFAFVALVISATGIAGVVAFTVSQRTHEIGIRMALGAARGTVLLGVVGQGMAPVGVGLGLGLVAALYASRFLADLLYGVTPSDPLTFASVASVLAVVAATACLLPARRATAIDPMRALRSE